MSLNNDIVEVPTKVYYLKMLERPNDLDSSAMPNARLVRLDQPVAIKDYLFYYRAVGEQYNWLDRLYMDDLELKKTINLDKSEIFIYYVADQAVGFAEFVREERYTEILYFGLLPQYIGKGQGKGFLSHVINEAWNDASQWIQLNTCELDHPNALPTYKRLGFQLDKTTVESRKKIKV